jgi:hypothetical protein
MDLFSTAERNKIKMNIDAMTILFVYEFNPPIIYTPDLLLFYKLPYFLLETI